MKNSLYGQYIKEREGLSIIERDYGFVTYSCTDGVCFVSNLYIQPQHRRSNKATEILNEVVLDAKEKNCKILKGSVCPMANGATEALAFHLSYGLILEKSTAYAILFRKEI